MESEPPSHRQSILTSFLSRGSRPRSAVSPEPPLPTTPIPPSSSSGPQPNASSNSHRRRPATTQTQAAPSVPSGFSQMLRRRRSGQQLHAPSTNTNQPTTPTTTNGANNTAAAGGAGNSAGAAATAAAPINASAALTTPQHRLRLVPHLDATRSLHFDPVMRECREGAPPLRIGRFTDRSGVVVPQHGKIAFKSKVVSRGHAEIWCEEGGKFFIKDTSSSSGTFLNHIRLSAPGTDSRPFTIKDGDVLQLGVDYQGGTEEIYRCVKIRIELGREWQTGANAFNTNALKQLKALTAAGDPTSRSATPDTKVKKPIAKPSGSTTDCCICLFGVGVCQSLFIAPCSHVFHYKCIRPLLLQHHPGFSCPLCRTFANLEEDVEIEQGDDVMYLPGVVLKNDAMEEDEEGDGHGESGSGSGGVDGDGDVVMGAGIGGSTNGHGQQGGPSDDEQPNPPGPIQLMVPKPNSRQPRRGDETDLDDDAMMTTPGRSTAAGTLSGLSAPTLTNSQGGRARSSSRARADDTDEMGRRTNGGVPGGRSASTQQPSRPSSANGVASVPMTAGARTTLINPGALSGWRDSGSNSNAGGSQQGRTNGQSRGASRGSASSTHERGRAPMSGVGASAPPVPALPAGFASPPISPSHLSPTTASPPISAVGHAGGQLSTEDDTLLLDNGVVVDEADAMTDGGEGEDGGWQDIAAASTELNHEIDPLTPVTPFHVGEHDGSIVGVMTSGATAPLPITRGGLAPITTTGGPNGPSSNSASASDDEDGMQLNEATPHNTFLATFMHNNVTAVGGEETAPVLTGRGTPVLPGSTRGATPSGQGGGGGSGGQA